MIPRLGDGNDDYHKEPPKLDPRLENDSPSRGRKPFSITTIPSPITAVNV